MSKCAIAGDTVCN